jgi:hypothetical protein
VLHGAPLLLVWALVDVRSLLKLGAATVALGVAVAGALDLATHGGFLESNRLWLGQGQVPGQLAQYGRLFVETHAPLMLAVAVLAVVAWRRGAHPLRDPTWALYVAGAVGLAMLGKFGAWTSYLLLWVVAHAVLVGRLGRGRETLALGLASLAILAAIARFQFPVPTAQNRASAAFVAGFVRARGGPILASKLESLYAAVGQDEEIESDGLVFLMRAHAPGIERIFARLGERHYRTVVVHPHGLPLVAMRVLASQYSLVGICDIGFWHATYRYALWVPRDEAAKIDFAPPPDAACARAPGERPAVR